MKLALFCVVLIGIIFFSCTEKGKPLHEYDSNGVLIKSTYFTDSLPSKIIKFQNDTIIEVIHLDKKNEKHGICYKKNLGEGYYKETNYIHGQKHGNVHVMFDDGSRIVQPFNHGEVHGVEYFYNSSGNIDSEIFWIMGKPILEKEITYLSRGDKLYCTAFENRKAMQQIEIVIDQNKTMEFYNLLEINDSGHITKKVPVGNLDIIDNTIDTTSIHNAYHYVDMPDTIYFGDTLIAKIKIPIPNINECIMKLKVGELKNDLSLEAGYNEYTFEKNSLEVELPIDNYEVGYNLITGYVQLEKDDILIMTNLLFEDFIVLPTK
ncbi:toxin-antitoxin system YwqK family antitoxin [Carboxylicivirga linearis]|uniref:Lipoprotein n=1 Tax=Carboxylicivirga linearis TaxID=1628157 RepID=A0ABS5JY15_9BACT|nr:hypothetical protein [Carboxylicivirga linearis]MBS2099822.1 hypothetical protein [Carboxylicivirga linearis]